MISFILIAIAFGFYYLSYKSPQSDLILYGISGIFFILAGVAGFWGYGIDIQTGETITYTYSNVSNQILVDTETVVPVYSENRIFTQFTPIILFLVGLYLLIVLAINGESKNDRRERKE